VRGSRRLLAGLAAATAVVALNAPAAGATEAGAAVGPWCTGTSAACHSWDSFHAARISQLRNDIYLQDARDACRRAISLNTRCDVTRFDTHRHWTPWRAYTYGPFAGLFHWRGWHSFRNWEFWH
jgi:hypothetical protein